MNNHLEVARYLLENGVSINLLNMQTNTILHTAASNLNYSFVKMLIEWRGKDGSKAYINKWNSQYEILSFWLLKVL